MAQELDEVPVLTLEWEVHSLEEQSMLTLHPDLTSPPHPNPRAVEEWVSPHPNLPFSLQVQPTWYLFQRLVEISL